jgi:hypothetical protein
MDVKILTIPLSAQRNVYLTGFCLFLSLVLTRTFYIIHDLIHVQDEYAKLKKTVCLSPSRLPDHVTTDGCDQTAANSRDNIVAGDQTKEIERLKKDLGKHFTPQDRYFNDLSTFRNHEVAG